MSYDIEQACTPTRVREAKKRLPFRRKEKRKMDSRSQLPHSLASPAQHQPSRPSKVSVAAASTTRQSSSREEPSPRPGWLKLVAAGTVAACLGTYLFSTAPLVSATETRADTWKCLLSGCRQELVRCLTDPACAAHALCLEMCNPDNMECQVRCGDVFQNKVISEFNTCVVTKHQCISQRPDDFKYPVPGGSSLVNKFNLSDFTGEWYITSGLNKAFDTFDCQVHHFTATPRVLTGQLTWRVALPTGGFVTRNDVQSFVQDSRHPGHLFNHDNQYLNYKDDWFIVSTKFENKPDDFVFIYYRGSNDAWDGYGGAIVYTRSASLPRSIVPQLKEAATKVGLDFDKFLSTDNSCKPEPRLLANILK